MNKYRIKQKVWGELPTPFGRVAFEFKAGVTAPKSEQEESCLEQLVASGAAERVSEESDAS